MTTTLANQALEFISRFQFDALSALLLLACLLFLLLHLRKRRLHRTQGLRQTPEGRAVFVLCAIFIVAATNTRINLLYFVAGLLLTSMLISLILVRRVNQVKVTRTAPRMIAAGEAVEIRLTLTNSSRRATIFTAVAQDYITGGPVTFDLPTTAALLIKPKSSAEISYRCTFPERGVYRLGKVIVRSRFPFGMMEYAREHALPQEVIVHPAIGSVSLLPGKQQGFHGRQAVEDALGEEEFSHLRDYRPDDNTRRIHWRTSARLQQLHVMEFRGTPANVAEVRFDPRVPEATPATKRSFERAARVAATIADELTRKGYVLRFQLNGSPPIQGAGSRLLPAVLETLARVGPVLATGGQSQYSGNGFTSFCIVVTPTGHCRLHGQMMVAAADDPALDSWYSDAVLQQPEVVA